MKKNFKITLLIFLTPLIFITLIIILILIGLQLYKTGILVPTYSYIGSVEYNNKRYSLYEDKSPADTVRIIFESNMEYKGYKKVKISVSLDNTSSDNKFIYHTSSDDIGYIAPKLQLVNNHFLIFSVNGVYLFLYDLESNKKYFDTPLTILYCEDIGEKFGCDTDNQDYLNWKTNSVDKKIREIINE